jgi:hypothetical protein
MFTNIGEFQMTKIKFNFHPYDFENKLHVVEKQEGNVKRRYLQGISSGSKVDGHGERLLPECIESFQAQASSGDVLLYEGLHGVNFVDDIGKLVKSSIMPNGDWLTLYRLYDEQDKMGPNTLEKADKLWRQVNGLPPYKVPMQKGFSIEGEIPDDGIMTITDTVKRVMRNVILDGVVVVPRPAYRDSVAHAVYKALGVPAPWVIRKNLTSCLRDVIDNEEKKEEYFKRRWQIDDALNDEIEKIMSEGDNTADRLGDLFDEYKNLMTEFLIQDSSDMFKKEIDNISASYVLKAQSNLQELFGKLSTKITFLKGLQA